MNTFFITGTDTGIGKTYVTCKLAEAATTKVNILKPIATGCTKKESKWIVEDIEIYRKRIPKAKLYTGQCFEPPVSPHLAAELAEVKLSAEEIATWCKRHIDKRNFNLIEGAGGLYVPLNDKQTWVDVMRLLNIPVIVVVGIKLGCINHALLTASALQKEGLKVEGWIANHVDKDCLYPEKIESFLVHKIPFPLLGSLPYESTSTSLDA